jgi:hypothetical protein
MKKLICILVLPLVGCASQSMLPKSYDDIRNATANCVTARSQIDYMTTQIKLYQDAHRGLAQTDEDRKYIGKAKNIIWSLRSTCPANYL